MCAMIRSDGLNNIDKLYGYKPRVSKFFDSMVEGIILDEIICNEYGSPYDFKKTKINPAFEKITGLKNIERADSLSEKYALLLHNAKDIILIMGGNGKILEANKAAMEAYGYTYEEFISFNIEEIMESQFNRMSNSESKDIYDNGVTFETMHQRKDGTVFPVEVSSTRVEFNGEYIILSIVRDITERKALEEKLQKLAYYDPATELPNKKMFGEYIIAALDEVKTENKMLAVLFVDLDRYKKINDTMGHLIGDRLLRESAERFKTLVDDNVFAARVGGDEFIFVQKGISNAQEAAELAYKILNEIKAPFNFEGYQVHITTSIGISLYPEHGEDVPTLMKNADTSMYRVKNKGRNNYEFYTPGMNKEVYEGVENIEQQDFLRQKQCYEMQGYLFGKPMSKEDFGKIILEQNNIIR